MSADASRRLRDRLDQAAAAGQASPTRQRLIIYLIVVAIGGAGMLLKRPFGLFLYHLMGKAPGGPQTPLQWLTGEGGWIVIVAVGLLLHHRSGLPTAPGLERLLFKDTRRTPQPMIWRPGLVGALVTVAIFAAAQVYQTISGAPAPLTARLSAGALPRAEVMTLAALYPLGVIGAGFSEEVIFRFGLMSALMGSMSLAGVGGRDPNNAWAFWLANAAQALWFGFGHVAEGLVASAGGGLAVATLTAPQTWSGLVFGYVYRRRGLEAAIVAHIASDVLVPLGMVCWRLAIRQ